MSGRKLAVGRAGYSAPSGCPLSRPGPRPPSRVAGVLFSQQRKRLIILRSGASPLMQAIERVIGKGK